MRIALDASTVGTIGGPRTYVLNLARNLARLCPPEMEILLLTPAIPGELLELPLDKVFVPSMKQPYKFFSERFFLKKVLERMKTDIYHGTKSSLPVGFRGKTAATIHDTLPLDMPSSERFPARLYWRWAIPHAARTADRIIVPSEHARRRLTERFAHAGSGATVIHHGIGEEFSPRLKDARERLGRLRKKYGIGEQYILSVGTFRERKGQRRLIKAYRVLQGEGRQLPQLVLAGRGTKARSHDAGVTHIGCVPDEDLPLLYAGARVFVFLSTDEGFGLPPLEACASGVPVLASNRGAMPEVLGDAALLVNPENTQEVASNICGLLENQELQSSLSQKGIQRAGMFSWEVAARKTLSLYDDLC